MGFRLPFGRAPLPTLTNQHWLKALGSWLAAAKTERLVYKHSTELLGGFALVSVVAAWLGYLKWGMAMSYSCILFAVVQIHWQQQPPHNSTFALGFGVSTVMHTLGNLMASLETSASIGTSGTLLWLALAGALGLCTWLSVPLLFEYFLPATKSRYTSVLSPVDLGREMVDGEAGATAPRPLAEVILSDPTSDRVRGGDDEEEEDGLHSVFGDGDSFGQTDRGTSSNDSVVPTGVAAILAASAPQSFGSEAAESLEEQRELMVRDEVRRMVADAAVAQGHADLLKQLSQELNRLGTENAQLLESALSAETRYSALYEQWQPQNAELHHLQQANAANQAEIEQLRLQATLLEEQRNELSARLAGIHGSPVFATSSSSFSSVSSPQSSEPEDTVVSASASPEVTSEVAAEFDKLQGTNAELLDHNQQLAVALQNCHDRLMESRREQELLRNNLMQAQLEIELLEQELHGGSAAAQSSNGVGKVREEDEEEKNAQEDAGEQELKSGDEEYGEWTQEDEEEDSDDEAYFPTEYTSTQYQQERQEACGQHSPAPGTSVVAAGDDGGHAVDSSPAVVSMLSSAYEATIEELRGRISELEERLAGSQELQEQFIRLKQVLSERKTQMEALVAVSGRLKERLAELQSINEKLAAENGELMERVELLEQERAKVLTSMQQKKAKFLALVDQLQQSEARCQELEKQLFA